MARIADFQCTYDNAAGFGTWASDDYGILFPEGYKEAGMMVKLAKAVKEHNQAAMCQIPFCHTLEAEALGGKIRLGDGVAGPRAGAYICKSLEEVLELSALSLESEQAGRLRETLRACRMLKEMGEPVVFLVSGPMTILNGLVDPGQLFRAFLKKPELAARIFEAMGRDILTVMKAAEEAGADMISYADPAGGINIVGPKVAERVVDMFTAPFLKLVEKELTKETAVLLCPKTAFALIGTEAAQWKDWELSEPMEYLAAVLYMKKQIRFAGQDCMNHVGRRLENRIFKELVLKERMGECVDDDAERET